MALAKHLNPNLFSKNTEANTTRHGFGEGIVEAAKKDKKVMALCCDLTDSVRLGEFKKQFPDRYVQVGVAEQNMAGLAAGMAHYGKTPFIASYATFSPGRNWDQVRISLCYGNANVKIVGAHAGISVGKDGATHQALEDIASIRALPNITIVVPCDFHEAKKATIVAAQTKGPWYLRLTREKTPIITTPRSPFQTGKAWIARTGRDVTVIACGPLLYEALLAAECLAGNKNAMERLLERYPAITKRVGISKLPGHSAAQSRRVMIWTPAKIKKMLAKRLDIEVINCATIKPLDAAALAASAKKTKRVVTVEEHQIIGGLFGAVSELLVTRYPVRVTPVGMPNSFGESGDPMELLEKYGMTAPFILEAILKILTINF